MSKTPTKFVGLHAHDGFSTFDGLDYPQDHIDFVRENGMNALAITNHGHMNSFAHAYLHVQKLNAQGANFKFITGCEMYVHPDLQTWQLQYDLAKATKKGNEIEVQRIKSLLTNLDTPLSASIGEAVDDDDGTSPVMFDDTLHELNDEIDLTEIIFEELTLILPLYPKIEGAELGCYSVTEPGVKPLNEETIKPFAQLSKFKDKLLKKK